ncbi:HNH endonuclease [Paenibacillus sp. YAF4_2]|uniref:HNH endonuclease n=1 Tax=Paenibacillus sp. YAF4_2 TaxID=3233085 RepID=UPI003F9C4E6F
MLIKSHDDLVNNLLTFNEYFHSDFNYYSKRLGSGNCFVVWVGRYVNLSFAPSRFIGYTNNSKDVHEGNMTKDGGVTNKAIRTLLGVERPDNEWEQLYVEYCLERGVQPQKRNNKQRKFWVFEISLNDEYVFEDINGNQHTVPISTDKESKVLRRVGQDRFRSDLIQYWRRCSVTGSKSLQFLRASHMKPWRKSDNKERLDPFNGFLLTPNLDVLFNDGYITFSDGGNIIISNLLTDDDAHIFGLSLDMRVELDERHLPYLKHHRENEFKS